MLFVVSFADDLTGELIPHDLPLNDRKARHASALSERA